MKRLIFILYLISFLLISWSAFSQAVTQTGFVGKFSFQSFSAGGSSDVTGTLDAFSDQTNQYFANNIQIGDVIWDNQGNRWEVMAVNSSNLLQADVDLRSVNGAGGTPFGVGFVSRETPNMGLSLFVPDNNIGISQQLKSRIESHNMLLIDQYVASNQDSVFTGATAADTTTVSDPTIGDVLVADNGDVGYYDGSSWVVSSGGSSTWLKPELEAGDVTIFSNDNFLIQGVGAGADESTYFLKEGVQSYDASGGSILSPAYLELSRNGFGFMTDEVFDFPDFTRAQLGNFWLDTQQDTSALEGYKLGLQYGKIRLLPDDTGGASTWLDPELQAGDVTITSPNKLTLEDTDGGYSFAIQDPGALPDNSLNFWKGGFDIQAPAGGYLGVVAGNLYFGDAGGDVDLETTQFDAPDLTDAIFGNFHFNTGQDVSGTTGYVLTDTGGGYLELQPSAGGADGNGIYSGSGNVPDGTEATLADAGSFAILDNSGADRLRITEEANIAITATTGFTATTTSGILGLTHTGSSGQLIVQSQDERATFQGEEARVIGDTLARMTVGTGDVLVKNALVDLTAGSSDFATLDGSINEFRLGTHDIVFEGTDGFYPEWKFETPVAANDWRMWTGGVGLTLQNGAGENTIVIANGADPALSVAADGVIRGVQYDNARHDTDNVQGNYSVGDNGDFLKTFDGEFNFRDDADATSTNTSTIIMNNASMQLPSALTNAGKIFIVIANSLTSGGSTRDITVAGGGTIEGNASLTMDNAYEVYALVSNGTEYVILWNKP